MTRMRRLRSAHFWDSTRPGLDGLAKTDLVRQESTLGQRRVECEECGVNLMRVEVHLGTRHRTGELLRAVRRVALRQLVGEVLCLVRSNFHS